MKNRRMYNHALLACHYEFQYVVSRYRWRYLNDREFPIERDKKRFTPPSDKLSISSNYNASQTYRGRLWSDQGRGNPWWDTLYVCVMWISVCGNHVTSSIPLHPQRDTSRGVTIYIRHISSRDFRLLRSESRVRITLWGGSWIEKRRSIHNVAAAKDCIFIPLSEPLLGKANEFDSSMLFRSFFSFFPPRSPALPIPYFLSRHFLSETPFHWFFA